MPDQVDPLLDVREHEEFQRDQRDVAAALVYARPYAQTETFKDRQTANGAADAIKGLKNVVKQAEETRKKLGAPYRATTEHINGHYTELGSQAKAAIEVLTKKGLAFQKGEREQVAREQREEKERLDREAEKKAEEAQAAAELANEEPESSEAQQLAAETHREAAAAAVATPPRSFAPPKQLRGDFAGLGSRTEYRFEVVDAAVVPPEHKIVNEKSIKAAIKGEKAMAKAQERDFNLQLIPGLRIWADEVGVSH